MSGGATNNWKEIRATEDSEIDWLLVACDKSCGGKDTHESRHWKRKNKVITMWVQLTLIIYRAKNKLQFQLSNMSLFRPRPLFLFFGLLVIFSKSGGSSFLIMGSHLPSWPFCMGCGFRRIFHFDPGASNNMLYNLQKAYKLHLTNWHGPEDKSYKQIGFAQHKAYVDWVMRFGTHSRQITIRINNQGPVHVGILWLYTSRTYRERKSYSRKEAP